MGRSERSPCRMLKGELVPFSVEYKKEKKKKKKKKNIFFSPAPAVLKTDRAPTTVGTQDWTVVRIKAAKVTRAADVLLDFNIFQAGMFIYGGHQSYRCRDD